MEASHSRPIAIAPTPQGAPRDLLPCIATEPTMPYTCVTCTKRKVKCDKSGPPCSTCKRGRHECFYEAPPPRKRKRKPVDDVHQRLERYESLLKQYGIINEAPPKGASSPANRATTFPTPDSSGTDKPSMIDAANVPSTRTGKMLAERGKTRYIDSALWHTLTEQQQNPSDDEGEDVDPNQPFEDIQPSLPTADPLTAAVFSSQTHHINLIDFHPTYDMAMKLWDIFTSHVDPLTKTFHLPTASAMIKQTASSPGSVSKTNECLVFAVYFFAVVAMTEEECLDLTGQPQRILWGRYHDATRQALVNAHLLRTTEKDVLQAYVLFLLAVRSRYDTNTFWVLTGVAIRIGQRLGLHRDGDDFGLKPFDAEMRRRLFWQLLPLEGMAAQMCGGAMVLPYDWNVRQPSNLNDADIHPGMTTLPPDREGATDMILIRIRAEMGKFHAKEKAFQGSWDQLWLKGDYAKLDQLERGVSDLQDKLEINYLRYCDFVIPSHCLAMAMARGTPCVARLRLRLPKAKVQTLTVEESTELCNLCVRVLDYTITARVNPLVRRFNWHMSAYFQWEPVVWILNELRKNSPAIVDPQGVWQKFRTLYEEWPEFISSKRTLYVAVARLMTSTWDARPAHVSLGRDREDPSFIKELRALVRRREASRSGNSVPSTVPPASLDVEIVADVAHAAPSEHASTFDGLFDFSPPDTIDWAFWDQLIKDPNAFQTS